MKKLFAAMLLIVIFVAMGTLVATPVLAAKADDVLKGILPEEVVQDAKNTTVVPTGDLKTAMLPQAIKILLGIAGSVAFGVFVYAGINLVISQGSEEDLTKAKNIFIWSLIGLAFITAAYALVRGIMQLAL